jgi:methylmalonyl-CoA/ethylmalonyl-CoA epimerase
MLKNIDHIGIVVPSIDASRVFYEQIYGCKTTEPIEISPGLLASFVHFNNSKLELLEPIDKEGDSDHAWFLRDHPKGGIHHIAYSTDDVEKTIECLDFVGCNASMKPKKLESIGKTICFLDPYYSQNILTEIISSE